MPGDLVYGKHKKFLNCKSVGSKPGYVSVKVNVRIMPENVLGSVTFSNCLDVSEFEFFDNSGNG